MKSAVFSPRVVSYKHRMILMTAYSAGLRISEVVNLHVKDIDSQRRVIHVRQGKRNKDRYTVLSPLLWEMLRHYCWGRPAGELPVSGQVAGQTRERHQGPERVQGSQAAMGIDKEITPHTFRPQLLPPTCWRRGLTCE